MTTPPKPQETIERAFSNVVPAKRPSTDDWRRCVDSDAPSDNVFHYIHRKRNLRVIVSVEITNGIFHALSVSRPRAGGGALRATDQEVAFALACFDMKDATELDLRGLLLSDRSGVVRHFRKKESVASS